MRYFTAPKDRTIIYYHLQG